MTQKERYDKICELVDSVDDIKDKIWNIVWEAQEGNFKAIIGILNDASRLVSSISNYRHWFGEK